MGAGCCTWQLDGVVETVWCPSMLYAAACRMPQCRFCKAWLPLPCCCCDFQVTVELKNDLAITGTLHSVDQYLNIKLNNIRVVNEQKYPHMLSVRAGSGLCLPVTGVGGAVPRAAGRCWALLSLRCCGGGCKHCSAGTWQRWSLRQAGPVSPPVGACS